MTYHELMNQAMQLPSDQRERLATSLLESVNPSALTEVDDAWIEEAERRYQEFLRDPSIGIPAQRVHERITRKHGWT